ncbi:MAG TPA: LuxR C-terminal-related transcriptional regulator [Thermoanaerobaculia bacterium]|jgi:PAS domain S-box-containing protein
MRQILERQLRAVIDNAPDGVLVESGDRILYLNPAYAQMLGYPSTSELTDATIQQIAHPEDFERLRWFGRCRSEGKPAPTRYTFRAQCRGGGLVHFDASISTIKLDGEMLITTVVRQLIAPAEEVALDLNVPGAKRLSARELEIVRELLAGRRSKEIATLLGISEKTVCTHRSRAFQKLALRGVADLFRLASERGMLHG